MEEVSRDYSVDDARIYAAGVSNGGMMSYRVGCEMDEIAAVAAVVALLPIPISDECSRSFPVMGIVGTEDPFVSFTGEGPSRQVARWTGEGIVTLSADATMEIFARNNSCDPEPTITKLPVKVEDGTSVEKYAFNNCSVERALEYYVVDGMGHGWPPKPSPLERISGPSSGNIDATETVWDFLSVHSL